MASAADAAADAGGLGLDTLDLAVLTLVLGAALYFLVKRFTAQKSNLEAVTSSSFSAMNGAAAGGGSMTDDRDFVAKMEESGANIVVFYGSQTGTAEDYAERLAGEARRYGLKALVCDIQDYDMEHLEEMHRVENAVALFALATYGEGEPTDNMQEFYEELKRRVEDDDPWDLQGARFAVFGLGNRTYEHFNAMGIFVDKALEANGGKRLLEVGQGDDDKNLEEDFANWKDEVWPIICEVNGKDPHSSGASYRMYEMEILENPDMDKVFTGEQRNLKAYENQKRPFTSTNPFLAPIAVRRELYKDSSRSCMHIELNTEDAFLRYSTGDHVAVYPRNNEQLVNRLGKRLGIDLDQVFTMRATDSFTKKKTPFPCPCTFRTALTYYVDITSLCGLNVLGELVQYATDEKEKAELASMVSKEGREKYNKFIHKDLRSVLHVLEDFPSVKIPIDHLLEMLHHLQPRYYSISSSSTKHPKSIHVTAAVVEYETPTKRKVEGVATNWLKRLDMETGRVPIFVRRSQFKLPSKSLTPVIMIGPGTGVAPFRGFVQERAALKAKKPDAQLGEMVLFFGCQKEAEHFMYREEFEQFVNEGVLTHLFTAFSRDQAEKVYVQHRIAQQAELIWSLLDKKKAYIYICGDAKHMARDVHAALSKIIQEKGGKSADAAEKYLKDLGNNRRFQQDVWS